MHPALRDLLALAALHGAQGLSPWFLAKKKNKNKNKKNKINQRIQSSLLKALSIWKSVFSSKVSWSCCSDL